MKVRIKKRFRDIETRDIMRVGSIAEYDTDRAVELSHGGFVELLDEAPVKKEEDAPSDADDIDTQKHEDSSDTTDPDITTEKVETTHTPKRETSKPGRKSNK